VPFIFFAERVLGNWGRWGGVTATIMASLSAFSVTLGASARILFALGRDRHFPRFFARLHRKHQTPDVALFVCAAIVIIFSSSGIVRFVASLSDFGYLMGLGIINYSVIPLHRKMPNLRRPFQTRFFPLIPILGVITTWVFVPALEARSFWLGGVLTAFGAAIYLTRSSNRDEIKQIPQELSSKIKSLVARLRRKRMRVLIISGKRQGQNIASRLLAKDEYRMMFRSAEHQVTFIEENGDLCQQLERRFNTPIFQGDGTKRDLLEQVGVENIDVVVAAYEDDGRNVIAALQARQLGWKQVIAIVQEPEYVELLEKNDVLSISAPWATASMVENLLDRPGLAQLFEFGIGAASVLDVTVPPDGRVGGKLIRDIEIPKECVIAAIIRDNTFVVPRGNTEIRIDDRVIFIGPAASIRKSCDMFAES
jgi:Trk K+ transport system NAD-binding subunit